MKPAVITSGQRQWKSLVSCSATYDARVNRLGRG